MNPGGESGKLFAEFPPVSTADWEAAIVRDLKGRDPKTLIWNTEDGFPVNPFYRADDLKEIGTTEVPLAGRSWHVGGEVPDEESLRRVVEYGVQAVIIPAELASVIPVDDVAIHLKAPVSTVAKHGRALSGSFLFDPIADFTADEAAAHFKAARETVPGMAAFVVDAVRFNNSAATATQELAFAMATGAEALAELTERGVKVEDAAASIVFSFGIGSNYFFEIAKLRAARALWLQIVGAFDAKAKAEIRIHATTSQWNKTVYDPYVNLLRATTEAMSAVIGGVEMLNVGRFDSLYKAPNEFSERLAINTQLILRDEAYFGKTGDAACGSWYLESLTDQIANSAWKIFQEVQAHGGMRKALAEGYVEQQIGGNRAKRNADIAKRKRTFLGVNQYANVTEQVAPELLADPGALTNDRGAYPFEAIRLATDRHVAKTGKRPTVYLARMGDVKMRRARAEFVANYFACGGFAITDPAGFDSVDAAVQAIKAANPEIVVLCSSDPEYPDLAKALCARIEQPVIIAGYPKDTVDALLGIGVADFVYLGSNAVETLSRWQKKLGVVS